MIAYLAILLCCLNHFNISTSTFPKPLYPDKRTAVIISGELRSGNTPINMLKDQPGFGSNMKHRYDNNSQTPIMTVLEKFLQPLALYGGVDVFLFIPAHPYSTKKKSTKHEPTGPHIIYPGDKRPCELYSKHRMFGKDTDNHVFCHVQAQTPKANIFVLQNPMWDNYCFGHVGVEVFLQQEYGKYAANLAAKQYAIANNITYAYKARLRPDLAFTRTFPYLPSLLYHHHIKHPNCSSIIYYPHHSYMGWGAEDSFNFGLNHDMDIILDRYIDMISDDVFEVYDEHDKNRLWWNSEMHMIYMLRHQHGICLIDHQEILMVKMRRGDYVHSYMTYLMPSYDWTYMNQPHDRHHNDEHHHKYDHHKHDKHHKHDDDGDMMKMVMFNASIHHKNSTCMGPVKEAEFVKLLRLQQLRYDAAK